MGRNLWSTFSRACPKRAYAGRARPRRPLAALSRRSTARSPVLSLAPPRLVRHAVLRATYRQCHGWRTILHVGAGKTTLLNALGGRATYGQVSGFVTLGGRPLTSQDLNYVPQFDDHNERFTPRELLTYMKHLQVRLRWTQSGGLPCINPFDVCRLHQGLDKES